MSASACTRSMPDNTFGHVSKYPLNDKSRLRYSIGPLLEPLSSMSNRRTAVKTVHSAAVSEL